MDEQITNTETEPKPPELIRPTEGRMLAGVAQGLSNRFDVPAWLVRLGFILLTFGGGMGVVLYAAGWFLIRSEEETEPPAARILSDTSGISSWLGIALVFVAVVLLLDTFTFLDGRLVWAAALLILGALLYTGRLPRLGAGSGDGGGEAATGETPPPVPTPPLLPAAPVAASSPPPPPSPPRLPAPRERSILGRLAVGAALLAMGVLAVLDNVPALAIEARPRHYLALAVTVLGVALLVGAFAGRARWLILVGIFMVPPLLFSPVLDRTGWSSVDAAVIDHGVNPERFSELESEYRFSTGNLVVDLSQLPWDGEEVTLFISAEAGNITVLVPEGVAIRAVAAVEVGRVEVLGRESGGIGSPEISVEEGGSRGLLVIEAHAEIGNIEIRRVGG